MKVKLYEQQIMMAVEQTGHICYAMEIRFMLTLLSDVGRIYWSESNKNFIDTTKGRCAKHLP
ncbi:MAG: hypothetical protein H6Q70_3719 [Firmicutes bacterium]|nr:hypothetical protein [Bacillota bacterium]